MDKINIEEKFKLINEYWSPKIVGELNGQQVKFAKLKGEFISHSHENEDEMFLVIKGQLKMQLRNKEILIKEGEFIIIPKGVEHKPIAKDEVHVLLFEPASTINTGNKIHELTKQKLEHI